jgi:hypothetical protein
MRRWIAAASSYLAWLVSAAVTVFCWAIFRTTAVTVADAIKRSVAVRAAPEAGRTLRWSVAAVDNFAIFGLGIAALGLVLAFDYIYRRANQEGRLWRTFGLVTGIQAALLVVCSLTLAVLRTIHAA